MRSAGLRALVGYGEAFLANPDLGWVREVGFPEPLLRSWIGFPWPSSALVSPGHSIPKEASIAVRGGYWGDSDRGDTGLAARAQEVPARMP